MKRTLIQFGDSEAPPPSDEEEAPTRVRCPVCAQHFSGDARFCPFDGEALEAAPDWDPSADPLIGSLVDARYEVIDVLGEGGMGTVYRARHVALGRQFAIKVLRRDLASDSELAVRFIQEAKAAAAVSHPNVVQITDFGRLESEQPYFVMELLDGRPLARIIKDEGQMPSLRVARIARQVAEALGAAHEAGVIHRDLKPDNIQITPGVGRGEIVKVLDFGLAKIAGTSRLTRQGMVFGTPHYMSPEQAAGEPIDQRVDIYALGVVMYEMLTGRLPFEADSFMGVLTKHIYMDPIPPSRVLGAGNLGPLEAFTLRCLQKKPSNRYGTMSELITDLDAFLAPASAPAPRSADHTMVAVSGSVDPSPPRVPTLPRWPLAAGVGALVVAVVAVTAWTLRSEPASPPIPAASIAPSPAASTPAPTELRPIEPVPTTAAEPSAAPSASADRAPVVARPARRTPPEPASGAPPPRTSRSTAKPGSGEIINPWAD